MRQLLAGSLISIAVVYASGCSPSGSASGVGGTGGGFEAHAGAANSSGVGGGGDVGDGGGNGGNGGATSTGGADGTGDVGNGGANGGATNTGGAIETGGLGTGGSEPGDADVEVGGAGGGSPRAGCALILHMDEPSWSGLPGEVMDSCGHNHGVAVGAPGAALPNTVSSGYFGRAGSFEDKQSCVQIPDDPSLEPASALTLAAWIFPTSFDPDSNGIIVKRVDYHVESSYSMFLWSSDLVSYKLWADIGIIRFQGVQALTVNHWYHVAVVFDGSAALNRRVRMYVNGALDAEFSEPTTSVPGTAAPLYLGCMPLSGPAEAFAGKIDDAAIWMRALGAAEILRIYQATEPL